MKKIISVLIIILLMMPIVSSIVLAETASSIYSNTEIEKLIREKLRLDSEIELNYSNLYTQDTRQKMFWNLEFTDDTKGMYVTVNAESGEINNFHRWGNDYYGKSVTILSDTAKKNAVTFIQALEPERFKETQEVTTEAPSMIIFELQRNYLDSDNYYFLFVRKVEGEFFPNNYFRVQVSGATGEVVQYEMSWDEAIYEKDQALISQEQARKYFEKEDRLQLKYVALNSNNKEEKRIPLLTPVYIYTPKDADIISAIDGRLFKREELYGQWSGNRPMYGAGGDMKTEEAEKTMAYDRGEVIPEEGALSKEKIEKIVLDALGKEIDTTGLKVQSSNYSNYYNGIIGKYWNTYWQDEESGKSLSAMVDAEKGVILSINFYKPMDEKDAVGKVISIERSMAEAIEPMTVYEKEVNEDNTIDIDEVKIKSEILKKMQRIFPHIQDEEIKFELADVTKESLVSVASSRYIEGIPYDGNNLNVTYNYNTREIMRFHYRWNEVEAQPASKIMDKKVIEKQLYDTVGFEKYLTQLKDQAAAKSKGLDLPLKKLALVYALKAFNFAYIDGISGKFLDYIGEEYVEDSALKDGFRDVRNHPYEQEIALMDKMGILKENSETFRPDGAILRRDAIKWIVEVGWRRRVYSLDGYYEHDQKEKESPFKDIDEKDPYYPYIVAAVKNGVLDKNQEYFHPEEEVTKLEVTKWLLKAMKQKGLAEFTEIFQMPYADGDKIQAQDVGYVALAKYYNIYGYKGSEETFEPEQVFTRGEFVKVLYHLLNHE